MGGSSTKYYCENDGMNNIYYTRDKKRIQITDPNKVKSICKNNPWIIQPVYNHPMIQPYNQPTYTTTLPPTSQTTPALTATPPTLTATTSAPVLTTTSPPASQKIPASYVKDTSTSATTTPDTKVSSTSTQTKQQTILSKPTKRFCDTGEVGGDELYNQLIHNYGRTPQERCGEYYPEYAIPSKTYCETGNLVKGENKESKYHNDKGTPIERCREFYPSTYEPERLTHDLIKELFNGLDIKKDGTLQSNLLELNVLYYTLGCGSSPKKTFRFITDSTQMINSMIVCLNKLQDLDQDKAEKKIVQYIENLRGLEKEPLGKAYALSQLKEMVNDTASKISADSNTTKTNIEDLDRIVKLIQQVDSGTTERLNKISETLGKLVSIVEAKKDNADVLDEIRKLSEELGMKDIKSKLDNLNKTILQKGTADLTGVTKDVVEKVSGNVVSTIHEQIEEKSRKFLPSDSSAKGKIVDTSSAEGKIVRPEPPTESRQGQEALPKTKQVTSFKTYVSIADDSGHKKLYECSECSTSGACGECKEVLDRDFNSIKPTVDDILKNINITITTTAGRKIKYKCECTNGKCEKCEKLSAAELARRVDSNEPEEYYDEE